MNQDSQNLSASSSSSILERHGQPIFRFAIFSLIVGLLLFVILSVYQTLIVPIFAALLLAYLLIPLVEQLDRLGLRRGVAAAAIICFSVAALTVVAIRFAPVLYLQVVALFKLIPYAMEVVVRDWLPMVEQTIIESGLVGERVVRNFFANLNPLSQLDQQLHTGFHQVYVTLSSLLGGAINVTLVPFLLFFLLKEYPKLASRMSTMVPEDLRGPVDDFIVNINATLRAVIKGQVMVACILAVLYVIGLSAVGLQAAVAIGVVAGLCRIIPYFDVVVGLLLSGVVIVANFNGWGQAFAVGIVFLVVQLIDGAIITPRIIGERIGLHPVIVIISIFASTDWFGLWGVFVAIPLLAVIKAIVATAIPYYRGSHAYRPEPGPTGLGFESLKSQTLFNTRSDSVTVSPSTKES